MPLIGFDGFQVIQVRGSSDHVYDLKVRHGHAEACTCGAWQYRSDLGPCKHMVAFNTGKAKVVMSQHSGTVAP